MSTTAFLIMSFSSLFAVIDPLGVIPFFSGLTSHMDKGQKRKVLIKALIVSFGVLAIFTFFGAQILEVFGITIDAFRIAGGVIFFGIGLDMLQSRPRRWRTGISSAYATDQQTRADAPQEKDLNEDDDPSITPLGLPMIAGPGSITTVMVLTPQAPAHQGEPLVLATVLAILLLTGAILMGADAVLARLGRTGLKIIEKLMGLLVTVIAVQLVIDGLVPVIRGMIS
ncbi:MAG: MarC family protein [Gemmatimonadales bacterium]|nr:MarC family protein [Gemmatimonadales bacterium]